MCEGGNQKNANIPENVEETLFAEDFVNHILLQFELPCLSSSITDYRSIAYNAFSPNVRVATNYLYRRLENENLKDFEKILKENSINRTLFLNYITHLNSQYLSMGFHAQKLLHFCVKTATMSVRFYMNGFVEGPALAVENILNILKDFDMATGGWDRLNTIAANYAHIYVDVDSGHLTPDSDSGELESESESQNSLSSDSSDASHSSAEDKAGGESKKDELNILDSTSDESSVFLEENNSTASWSKRTHVRNANEIKADDVQKNYLDTPSDSESSGSSEDFSVNPELQTSLETDGKIQKVEMQNKESSHASCSNSDEENSDVFDAALPAKKTLDLLVRQQCKKRPASSSSSVSDFYILESVQQPKSSKSIMDSTTNTDLNTLEVEQESKAGPSNIKISPIRKHVSKTRRN